MKKLIALLAVLATVLSLAACGGEAPEPTTASTAAPTTAPTTEPTTQPTTEPPLTAEQVFSSVSAAMTDVEATRLRMELTYNLTISEGEGEEATTTEMDYGMILDTIISAEPFGNYTLMDMAIEMPDYSMDYAMEVFIVEEDESVVAYLQMFDSWTRSDYEMTVEEFLASDMDTAVSTEEIWFGGEMPADMTLDEGTQSLNGTEVYILRGSIPAGDMGEALSNLGIEDTTVVEDLTMPVVYYVDAESYTIMRMEASMEFLIDILDNVLAESLTGSVAEGAQLDLQIPPIVYDLGYGPQDIPEVPQEAYDYIADQATAPTEDTEVTEPVVSGPLVLNCGDEALLITCPEGWSGEVYSENNIWIYNEDFSLVGDYYYFVDWTEEDILTYLVQSEIDSLQSSAIYVSHGDGPAIDGYTTMQVIGTGESYYFAWREAGDGWFVAYIYDYTGTDDATELLPQMLALVTPYSE